MKLLFLLQIGCFENKTQNDLNADLDGDGYTQFDGDCDDNDPDILSEEVDGDCDGVLTDDDCDDEDKRLGAIEDDFDCDGILTADDCDDRNPSSTMIANDRDCDGSLTDDDCDDEDSAIGDLADDADCDGFLTEEDCDDSNSEVPRYDADCDGVATGNDCDDTDPAFGSEFEDQDCDGVLTADDCDDTDDSLLSPDNDGDCDGIFTADDCDDENPLKPSQDQDCDDTPTIDDCDDNDPESYTTAIDGDCDGLLTADDCDDNDASLLSPDNDADCDGYLTDDDCDDEDPYANSDAGFNEPHQSAEACYSDADGDGYGDDDVLADTTFISCFEFNLKDSVSDGWSGTEIEVREDGVSTGFYSNDDSQGGHQWERHCILPSTNSVRFYIHIGQNLDEISFDLYYIYYEGEVAFLETSGYGYSNYISYQNQNYYDGDNFEIIPMTSPWNSFSVFHYGTDCDDEDASINPTVDGDGDGDSFCLDCDDSDPNIGHNPDDLDCDGAPAEDDCDDDDPALLAQADDQDCDGAFTSYDCDDNDPTLNYSDADGDQYATCPDGNGLVDCDDEEATTYPGAGYNELSFDPADYSTYECLTDGDGDGYIASEYCLLFEMFDSYGDGWNGNEIEIYEDSNLTNTITISDYTSSATEEHCLSSSTSTLEFYYNSRSYISEISMDLYYITPNENILISSGSGTSSGTFIFDNNTYSSGDLIYTESSPFPNSGSGSDPDDTNPSVP